MSEKNVEHKNRGTRSYFSNSILKRTLLIQFCMTLVILVCMFLFVNRVISGNQTERISELNSSQLWRVGEDVDTRLEGIRAGAAQILYSEDGISLMINPSDRSGDVGYRVISSLQRLADENELVDKALFYIPSTQEVYSSAGNYLDIDNSLEKSAIEDYLSVREAGRSGEDMVTFRLVNSDGRLFLAGDFCSPNFIGAIIIQLDAIQLNVLMQGTQERSQGRFFLMDEEQQAVLLSADIAEEANDRIAEADYYDVKSGKGALTSNYYIYHSDNSGLYYGLYIDWENEEVPLATTLLTFFPFLLIYALFTAIHVSWLMRDIYQPINHLMQLTVGQREELEKIKRSKYRNEIDYLEAAFRDAWGENLQNRELLADISQDMLEQLFRSLVMGKTIDSDYMNRTMKGLGLEEYLDGRYQAIAGCIRIDAERELTSMELGMYRRSLLGFLAEQKPTEGMTVSFFMDTSVFAILLGFHQDVSALRIKETTNQLIVSLNHFAEKLPYSLLLGQSKTCGGLDDIRAAYHEAYTQVEYLNYVSEDQEDTKESEPTQDYDRQYFREQGQKLAEAAEKERMSTAEEMARSILREMSAFDPDKKTAFGELLIDALLEKMIAVHVENAEIHTIHARMDRALHAVMDEEWESGLADTFLLAVHSIHSSSRRSRYRYVDSAKEYIAAHYSDGSLSLNEVSEAVGISAPYLSGIFSESEQIGFSAYLNQYRVEQAKQFLEQTTTNMTEIGYKCGFNSAQSFNRVFKKMTGFTPGQYREHVKNPTKAGE